MYLKLTGFLISLYLFSACSAPPEPTGVGAEGTPTSVPAATEGLIETDVPPGPTEPSIEPAADDATPTSSVFVPFTVINTVDNTLIRSGPGGLFDPKTTLAANTELVVYAVAPGREWVFVVTTIDSTGWIFRDLLEPSPLYATAPLIQPADVQVLRGRVVDTLGAPVDGIQFAVIEGEGGTGSPPRVDAVTDAEGVFYAFLPLDAAGIWTVSLTGVVCTSSQMGPNCECPPEGCGTSEPATTTVTLPTEDVLQFIWR